MKKFLTFCVMAIMMVVPLSLASCDDDNDDAVTDVTSSDLIGKWRCTSSYYEDSDDKETNEDVGSLLYLNADGTMMSIDTDGDKETGKWSVKNGILTIVYNDDDGPYPVRYTITECTADTLSFTARNFDSYIKVTFMRI